MTTLEKKIEMMRQQWQNEGQAIFIEARRTCSQCNAAKSSGLREKNHDRIIIKYEVNVDAFYNELSKKLDNTQLGLEHVMDKSKEVRRS